VVADEDWADVHSKPKRTGRYHKPDEDERVSCRSFLHRVQLQDVGGGVVGPGGPGRRWDQWPREADGRAAVAVDDDAAATGTVAIVSVAPTFDTTPTAFATATMKTALRWDSRRRGLRSRWLKASSRR
jgi:hypothetical protein